MLALATALFNGGHRDIFAHATKTNAEQGTVQTTGGTEDAPLLPNPRRDTGNPSEDDGLCTWPKIG